MKHEPGVKVAIVNNWAVVADRNAVKRRALAFEALREIKSDEQPWESDGQSVASNTDNLCKLIAE